MTSREKLEALIQKAIDGGWDTTHFDTLKASYKHPDESEFHDLMGDWHGISPLDVVFNHDFARALFGEYQEATWIPHDVPAKRPDFRPWKNELGIDYVDWSHVPNELYLCTRCKKPWGKAFVVIVDSYCKQTNKYNAGFELHLQQAVVSTDPIDYMYQCVLGKKS